MTTSSTSFTTCVPVAETCNDSNDPNYGCTTVTSEKCAQYPGKYAINCPKKCQNCDGKFCIAWGSAL